MAVDLKAHLSSRDLSDVPAGLRVGSPHDAADRKVRQHAKRGLLHPRTNYAVVYRVAFAHLLDEDEAASLILGQPVEGMPTGLALRFCNVVIADAEGYRQRRTTYGLGEPGWVLLTDRRLIWHLCADGVGPIRQARELPHASIKNVTNGGNFFTTPAGLIPAFTIAITTTPSDDPKRDVTHAFQFGAFFDPSVGWSFANPSDDNHVWLEAFASRIPGNSDKA